MEDFFHAIYELSKKERIIIAIDEFQQIASLGDLRLDAFLRKHIQARGNTSYFFLGSKRHLLTSLFEYQAPLYEMATHHSLAPLALEDVYTYSQKHLPITEPVCAYLYERSDGETKMMQRILHGLYIRQPEAITQDDVDSVIEEILIAKDTSYRLLFDTLTNSQKLALKLIAKHRSGLFSAALLAQHHIKKQTLQSAIDALLKRELIDKEREGYFIPDRTLELWAEKISR